MSSSQNRRMWLVGAGLLIATLIVVMRLFVFQVVASDEWSERTADEQLVTDTPERGVILDRNGTVLAINHYEYRVGVSPSLIINKEEVAADLSPILEMPRYEILAALQSQELYVTLAGRVSAEVAQAIEEVDDDIQLDPLPRRYYPHDELMCQVLGYVDFDGNGGAGVEGYFQQELAGQAASDEVNISPLVARNSVIAREGTDLVLTIDRSVQFLVERHLREAMAEHGAVSGDIIVIDPRTGAILAMASAPCYSPNEYMDVPRELLFNRAVTAQYEPGSVMKLMTMAAALDSGTVTPSTTYNDTGEIWVGGHRTVNWDRAAYGTMDMTGLLAHSLNVGAATIATWMGSDVFFDYFSRFGFGSPTGIEIMSESPGLLPLPGSEFWQESFLATDAYGQSMAVTPLQMAVAVSALANHGYLMQPHIVQEKRDSNGVRITEPTVAKQVISPETADIMTAMAVTAVNQEVTAAMVPGYTVAGKTGTAQIAENGIYHPTDVIGSFVGWLPADDPEVAILVKLDRPTSAPWGSMTAAPAFAKLAKDLVVMLDIPPDEIRLQAEIVAARNRDGQ